MEAWPGTGGGTCLRRLSDLRLLEVFEAPIL